LNDNQRFQTLLNEPEKLNLIPEETIEIREYFKSAINYTVKILEEQKEGYGLTNNIASKIISYINSKAEDETKQNYIDSLIIELIDSGTMYQSGTTSCTSGCINKTLSIIAPLNFSDHKDTKSLENNSNTKKFAFEGFKFIFSAELFAERIGDKSEWSKKPDFLKAQEIRGFIFKMLKDHDFDNNVFIKFISYNDNGIDMFSSYDPDTLISTPKPQEIIKFKNQITYIDIIKFSEGIKFSSIINDFNAGFTGQKIEVKTQNLQDNTNASQELKMIF
jgi:hypothetical protein